MRASPQEQTGGAGLSEVSAAFERLGWGVVENARHDLGTDLFVMARDERLFDLGLVVGVQVKAGGSYFREPERSEDGVLLGWWFRDSDRLHVDAWVRHGLPHLLVLRDMSTRTSYWVHVTADALVATGKGAKVLVPVTSTLGEGQREALLGVAASARPPVSWEGSAWTGAGPLAPRDLLRHALLVPRLVAPHPNVGHGAAPGPEQAVALLAQARLRDLAAFAQQHPEVPTLAEATESRQWPWRFVGALGRRLTTGDVDVLRPMAADAPDPAAAAAATVAAAAGLLEEGRADEAIALLEGALGRDEAEPVDHAWLQVQHARALAEVGRLDEARAIAVGVQGIRVAYPDDVTATELAGVAAVLLFEASAWDQQDLAGMIRSVDTAAGWWRAQTVSRALTALTKRAYKEWGRDRSVTLGGSDTVNDQLLAASLTASHAGDHGGWRHLSGLLGKDALLRLDRHAAAEQARRGLDALRLAGDKDALKLAVRRLAADGPASAVAQAAADLRLEASTRTTGRTDLALLRHGGDLLDEETADRAVGWLLATLRDPSAFGARTTPSYLLDAALVDTLAAALPAASSSQRREVIDHVVQLPAQEDQLLATSWARVVLAAADGDWDEEAARMSADGADAHHEALRLPLLGVAARVAPAALTRLLELARGRSLDALAALGDVRTLPADVVTELVHEVVERVEQDVRDARQGCFGIGGHDDARGLALLNLWHPAAAQWEPLLGLLADEAVAGQHKAGALRVLANLHDRVPDEVRARLEVVAVAVARRPAPTHRLPFVGDATGPAADLAAALGALDPTEAGARLVGLLAGDADKRQWAAELAGRLGRPEDIGVLVSLGQDPDPRVRAGAAAGLAELVAADRGGALAAEALLRCAADPGTAVPHAVAAVLAAAPASTPAAQELLARLRGHPSTRVRAAAAAPRR